MLAVAMLTGMPFSDYLNFLERRAPMAKRMFVPMASDQAEWFPPMITGTWTPRPGYWPMTTGVVTDPTLGRYYQQLMKQRGLG